MLHCRGGSRPFVFAFAVLVCAALAASPASAAKAAPRGTVVSTSGSNTCRPSGATASKKLQVRQSLYIGDLVTTDKRGKAKLLFSDASQASLGNNARVEITLPSRGRKGATTLFRVVWGEVWVRLRPGSRVQTRSAAAGALGTDFLLSVDEQETTTVTVLEGAVDFYNEIGEVVVGPMQRSVARVGEAPTAPVTVATGDFTIEWTLDLERAAVPRERPGSAQPRPVIAQRLAEGEAAAKRSPSSASAHLMYAGALMDSRQPEHALSEYHKALRLQANLPEAAVGYGDALAALGRTDEAAAAYTEALKISPDNTAALVSLAYLHLSRNRPSQAEEDAARAVAIDASSADAHVARGIALLRQPGRSAEAVSEFEKALQAAPPDTAYQARSWLALAALQTSDSSRAIELADAAVRDRPSSALANGALALAEMFSDRIGDALKHARAAASLDPSSLAASLVLAQSLLAAGRADSAAVAAARAVALDPGLPEGYYLLGLADAGRRDYIHAERSLAQGLRVAPDFVPLSTTLARVYMRMGRTGEARQIVASLSEKHPGDAGVLAASGELAYETSDYLQAIASYSAAVDASPGSARYHAELARACIYANRISDAIRAGQQAVLLAPNVAEFHSILGQAYEYGGLGAQAELSYRAALALGGQNALALVKLGFANQEGDPRTRGRTAGLSFVQGFMLNPSISRELLRGGVDLETTVAAQQGGDLEEASFRDVSGSGRTRLYGSATRSTYSARPDNSDTDSVAGRLELTHLPSPESNAYVHFLLDRSSGGLLNQTYLSPADDRTEFDFSEFAAGYRHRLSDRSNVWVGAFGNWQRDELWNPNSDNSAVVSGLSLFGSPIATERARTKSRNQNLELRFDVGTGSDESSLGTLSIGAAMPYTRASYRANLFLASAHIPDEVLDPDNTGILQEERWFRNLMGYIQWTSRAGERLHLAAQIRAQRLNYDYARTFVELTNTTLGFVPGISVSPPSRNETRLLPSFALDYAPDPRTWVRLAASSRWTDVSSSIFAPLETIITTESWVLPIGLPELTNTLELSIQRYISPGESVKLFLFSSKAKNAYYEFSNISGLPGHLLGDVRRDGAGIRYEKPLGRWLYSQAGFVASTTHSHAPGMEWDGQTAPYHPDFQGFFRLNHIDSGGFKAGLALNFDGPFFDDTAYSIPGFRTRFGGKVRADVHLAKEVGVANEYFLRVTNLTNTRQIIYNDLPYLGRFWQIGWTHRM